MCGALVAAALFMLALPAMAAGVDTVAIDLLPLIREAAARPNQFAVNVPHAVSAAGKGEWTRTGSSYRWTYAVRIPGAVSLSFHAPRMVLPPGAVLSVRGAAATSSYRNTDASRGDLWSRVHVGDALELTLEVPATERLQVVLEIASFQVGFRGLTPDVPSHPSLQRARPQDAGDPDTPCVQNYSCQATPQNAAAGQATVTLLIGNAYLCTGTLINNTANDNTPYIITARHCQNGQYGGGNPGAAATVSVYWNAQTACGTPLDTVYYTPTSDRQTGATTVVEQQDHWLLQLDASPVIDNAQFAGFDASAGPVIGGYTVHHALAYNKQYTRWHGQAFASQSTGVLGTSFVSNLLAAVNEFGATGPGASGAALFSSADRVLGVLSLGKHGNSVSGYANCPAPSPPTPSSTSYAVSFNALSGVWDSTADTTSSTGTRTLRSVLDPGNTGATSVGSLIAARIRFQASAPVSRWNAPVTLSWDGGSATQCTASGGNSSDGWTGLLPATGSRAVSNNTQGDITYRLRCDLPGGVQVSRTLLVNWLQPDAQPRFLLPEFSAWVTRPVTLRWEAIVGPCSLTGGDLALTNLGATGSVTTTSSTPGDITYRLTCGQVFTSSTQHTVSWVTPTLSFAVSGTHRKLGQPLTIAWYSLADTCVPSGGSQADDWTSTTRAAQGTFQIPNMWASGVFDYGLNCISGPISQQRSIRVTVDDAEPFVTLIPEKPSVVYSGTPSDFIRIRYATNLSVCTNETMGFPQRYAAPSPTLPAPLQGISYTDGEWLIAPAGTGMLNVRMTCTNGVGSSQASATATASVLVETPPPPTMTFSATPTFAWPGTPITFTWTSNYAVTCNAVDVDQISGGWEGTLPTSGSKVSTLGISAGNTTLEAATFYIGCPSVLTSLPGATANAKVSIARPSLKGPEVPVTSGAPFTLTWNAPLADSCEAQGGVSTTPAWTTPRPTSGSLTMSATYVGTISFAIRCQAQGVQQTAEYVLTVQAAAGGSGGRSGSSSGGGGKLEALELLVLGLLAAAGAAKRRVYRRRIPIRARGASALPSRL